MEFKLCPQCLTLTYLGDEVLIFDNANDSELIKVGYCPLCKNRVERHYAMTKGDIT